MSSKTKKTEKKEVNNETEVIEEVEIVQPEAQEENKLKEAEDKYLRLYAEFDNFRKRTAKEKQALSESSKCDSITAFIPILDNLERAAEADGGHESLKTGIEMVIKQFKDTLQNQGVEEIENIEFDPNVHNAVMHIEDGDRGEKEIAEVLQKGYRCNDIILRHSMVKVAN